MNDIRSLIAAAMRGALRRPVALAIVVCFIATAALAADTKISALTAAGSAAGANEIPINEAGTTKKLTVTQIGDLLFTRVAGNSGAAGPYKTVQCLTANSSTNTSTTPAVVITTTGVGSGTWGYKYTLIYQTAATTTGIAFSVNHTGTAGQFAMYWAQPTTGTTTANATGDGASATAAGQLYEAHAERVINTVSVASVGVDTANTDVFAVLEGIVVITASGSLELKMATEIGTSGVTLQDDSCLELTKLN